MKDKKIKDLGGGIPKGGDYETPPPVFKDDYEEFKTILFNAWRVDGLTYDAERMFKNLIIENNAAGYLPLGAVIARAYPLDYDYDEYGNSKFLQFTFPDGRQVKRLNIRTGLTPPPIYGGYYITGLPAGVSYGEIIHKSVDLMRLCDVVIWQNLNAVKNAKVITVQNPDTLLSVKHAMRKIQAGVPIVEVSAALADALKAIDVSTPFIADRIGEFKRTIKDELLIRIGTMSANTTKRERVQATEVNATVGQCEDYIYSLIDNLNAQFEAFNLPLKARLNNSLEELYYNAIEGEETPPVNQ